MKLESLLRYAREVLSFDVHEGMPVRIETSCTGRDAQGRSRLASRGTIGVIDAIGLLPGNLGLGVMISLPVSDEEPETVIVTRFHEDDPEPQFPFTPLEGPVSQPGNGLA